jgi:hypothetical protein
LWRWWLRKQLWRLLCDFVLSSYLLLSSSELLQFAWWAASSPSQVPMSFALLWLRTFMLRTQLRM